MRAALQAQRVLSTAARRVKYASVLPACHGRALREPYSAAVFGLTRDLTCRFKSSDFATTGAAKPQPDHGEDAWMQHSELHQSEVSSSTVPWVPLLCVPAVMMALAATGGDVWGFYLRMLQEHPFSSRIATGMTGMFLGDLLAQVFPPLMARLRPSAASTHAPAWRYDVPRAARLILFSAVLGTPVAYYWYSFLDAVVNPLQPTAVSTVATKVALDQLLLTPIMTTAFFVAMCTMEGRAYAALDAVRTKLIPTLKANYMLWPAAHCINFAFIPGDQRILYINCVAVLWTVVLSTAAATPVNAATSAEGQQGGGTLVGRDDIVDTTIEEIPQGSAGGGDVLRPAPVTVAVNINTPGGKKLQ